MIELSIIVPVYNIRTEYLRKCFDSLSMQSMNNIEFIIVDDGSENDCAELCDTFAMNESRAQVIHQKNAGVSVARNTGIGHSIGTYLMFVDADDSLLTDSCDKLCEMMKENNFDILFFRYVNESENALREPNKSYINSISIQSSSTDVLCQNIISRHPDEDGYSLGAPWGKVFKRSFIENKGIRFVEGLKKAQDRVFMLNVLIRTPQIGFCNIVAYCYNDINLESVCHRYNPKILTTLETVDAEMVKVVNKYAKNPDEFAQAINKMRLQNILEYLHLYEFHPDNNDESSVKVQRLTYLRNNKIYSEAFRGIKLSDLKSFDKQRALKLFILKHGWIRLYVLLSSVGSKIKRK